MNSADIQEQLSGVYKVEFDVWKSKTGKETTGRNRLYQLFIEVQPHYFLQHIASNGPSQYGAIVLLDPVWNLHALQAHDGAVVHQALLALPERLEQVYDTRLRRNMNPLSILQPGIEQALVCIVDTIAGRDAALFVNDFIDDFEGLFRIPRYPD